MHKGILHTHYLVVILFLLIYVVKTVLLLSNKNDVLAAFTKKVKVAEMIISVLFLLSGIYLATQLPFQSKYDYLFWIKLLLVAASIPLAVVGFKKGNKILASLSLLLLTISFGIAESYKKKKSIPKDTIAVDAGNRNAAEIYQINCVMCHGADGKLGMAGASDLSASALSKEEIKTIILKGKGSMAAIAMSPEQADAVAAYVDSNIKGK